MQDIVNIENWPRALAHKILAANAMAVQRRSRHGKDFAVLIQGIFCGDQASGLPGGLNYDNGQGKTADQPVTYGKVVAIRRGAGRELADKQSIARHLFKKRAIGFGVY